MKKEKIIAIVIMLVLTVTTGLVVASDHEKMNLSDTNIKEAIEEARITLPFEEETEKNGLPPVPNPFMITTLHNDWNMIGYPNQGSIHLTMLAVIHNDTIYTWTEACEQQIVLCFVYNWDREQQWYVFVDEIEGGYGYWMFSYYDDCEIWSLY